MKYLNLSKKLLGPMMVVLVFSSCKTLDYYKEAVTYFSQAAELEVRQKSGEMNATNLTTLEELYAVGPSTPLQDTSSAKLYREASEHISKALSKPTKLKNSDYNLMGNAICLQSLAAWRLGNTQEALSKQKDALEELVQKPTQKTPEDERDITLMTALPALVDLEMAYDSMIVFRKELGAKVLAVKGASEVDRKALFDQLQAHYRKFIVGEDTESGIVLQAITHLEKSKTKAGPKHKIQSYILLSQLTGMNTWALEFSEIDNAARLLKLRKEDSPIGRWLEKQYEGYKMIRDAHLVTLEKMLPKGKADPTYISWKKRL